MNPTAKLRFVERLLYWDGRTSNAKTVKVLQQWWTDADTVFDTVTKDIRGEWRDIPLEEEK